MKGLITTIGIIIGGSAIFAAVKLIKRRKAN